MTTPNDGGAMTSGKGVHHYLTRLTWAADASSQTSSHHAYSRNHQLQIAGKPGVTLSADPAFMGDPAALNPEEFLVAALSSCHMLTYLSLAARRGLLISRYEDEARGEMVEEGHGGRFSRVDLHPVVTLVAGQDEAAAVALHALAHRDCYIANSVTFPVSHHPTVRF